MTNSLSYLSLTAILVSLGAAHFVYLVIWRLYYSPISKFPGSRLAAATGWYEFYYDFYHSGKYIFEIERMHNVYGELSFIGIDFSTRLGRLTPPTGPIIRVNPEELSIRDSSFYNELYVSGSKRRSEHYDAFASGIDFEGMLTELHPVIDRVKLTYIGSHILTRDHKLHHQRRKPLDPFFSRSGVQCLQAMLGSVVLKMEIRLREFERTHKVVRLDHVFSAFSSDVMCRLCLTNGRDSDKRLDFLDHPDFSPEWFNCINSMITSLPLFSGFPWIIHIVNSIPIWILLALMPAGKVFSDFRKFSLACIYEAVRVKEDNDRMGIKTEDHGSVFLHLANSDMPASERAPKRLLKEAQVLLAGGTATTSHTLGSELSPKTNWWS